MVEFNVITFAGNMQLSHDFCSDFYLQLEACIHPFFDELRDPNASLPNGRPLPPLFNFKPQG